MRTSPPLSFETMLAIYALAFSCTATTGGATLDMGAHFRGPNTLTFTVGVQLENYNEGHANTHTRTFDARPLVGRGRIDTPYKPEHPDHVGQPGVGLSHNFTMSHEGGSTFHVNTACSEAWPAMYEGPIVVAACNVLYGAQAAVDNLTWARHFAAGEFVGAVENPMENLYHVAPFITLVSGARYDVPTIITASDDFYNTQAAVANLTWARLCAAGEFLGAGGNLNSHIAPTPQLEKNTMSHSC